MSNSRSGVCERNVACGPRKLVDLQRRQTPRHHVVGRNLSRQELLHLFQIACFHLLEGDDQFNGHRLELVQVGCELGLLLCKDGVGIREVGNDLVGERDELFQELFELDLDRRRVPTTDAPSALAMNSFDRAPD